ncbi:MAG: phage tail protein [Ferruginibacter sp.]
MLDENNAVAMSWTLANAFPCKITVTDMKSDSNEAAVETMELAHEGLVIA